MYELYKTSDKFGKISKLRAKGGFVGKVKTVLSKSANKSRMVDGVDLSITGEIQTCLRLRMKGECAELAIAGGETQTI